MSIDVFRAVTMVLMVWVNDFWTLNSIPKWLKHASAGEDYLGFSDFIFPWFLFVLGMSIPFSFQKRFNNGESIFSIFKHIILRTVALLVMGLFHMNIEMYNSETALLAKPIFVIIITTGFFMVWNNYPQGNQKMQKIFTALRFIGILLLITMFLIFIGKDYEGNQIGFRAHWWGILGLIGWVYFISASTFVFIKNSLLGILIVFLAFLGINILSSSGMAYNIFEWQSDYWIPGNGGLQALAFGGIIVSLILIKMNKKETIKRLYLTLFGFSLVSLLIGLVLRNYFIINKIDGTPTWILISLSSAILLFIILYWLIDVKKAISWYKYIAIAGTSTLTCYLIPYLYYNMLVLSKLTTPIVLTTGIIGLLKSAVYTILIIGITWCFSIIKIQIKI
ncbi:MAG: hypothetical protein CMG55_10385 [Candidatus Marinimicrobia bacterium]|nr:hypothetical protein [Candidatus Neomarinimicrobiota bacterium]